MSTFHILPSVVRAVHLTLACAALAAIAACSPSSESAGAPAPAPAAASGAKSSGGLHAVLETDKGPIELELLESAAPKGVENFRLLAERGYYNGLTFHRIVRGFMIQGGDPSGDGTGGESAWGGFFENEIDPASEVYRGGYVRGVVAYANAGPNTNGSQFFIMHRDYELPPQYVIFAKVTGGMEAVDALAAVDTTMGADGAQSRPLTPPVIKTVTIRP